MANSVGVGKGNGSAGAYFYCAPIGTKLPTDATTELDDAYVAIGLLSSDGVTNGNSADSSDQTDFAGDTVYTSTSSRTETLSLSLIETSMASMKEAYGDANVTGSEGAFKVRHNGLEHTAKVYVIEVILNDHQLKRIVAPNGKVTALDDISYTPGDLVKYPLTLTCLKDSASGDTLIEYVGDVQ